MSLLRFYVGGKFADMHRVNALVSQIEAMSPRLVCTHNWAKRAIEKVDRPRIRHLTDAVDALLDVDGVVNADVVVLLMDDAGDYPYRGTHTELGCALGAKKPVILINPHGETSPVTTNVFYWHPFVTPVSSIEKALEIVKGFVEEPCQQELHPERTGRFVEEPCEQAQQPEPSGGIVIGAHVDPNAFTAPCTASASAASLP